MIANYWWLFLRRGFTVRALELWVPAVKTPPGLNGNAEEACTFYKSVFGIRQVSIALHLQG